MSFARVFLCALALALALVAAPARGIELTDLAAQARPSVVLITIYDDAGRMRGSGTGFFVSPDGRAVTNAHVIRDGARATATLADGKVVDIAGVLALDDDKDVAVVKVAGDGYAPLTLGESKSLKPGEPIALIGSPRGLSGSLSVGVVSAIRERGLAEPDAAADETYARSWGIQITAPMSPGSSGSPILRTTDGTVVAVAVGQVVNAQNLNFGVPVEVARALVDSIAPGAAPKPLVHAASSHLLRNLGISAAIFAVLGAAGYWASRRPSRSRARVTPRRPS
jgi:S1-C subfamily serine protease